MRAGTSPAATTSITTAPAAPTLNIDVVSGYVAAAQLDRITECHGLHRGSRDYNQRQHVLRCRDEPAHRCDHVAYLSPDSRVTRLTPMKSSLPMVRKARPPALRSVPPRLSRAPTFTGNSELLHGRVPGVQQQLGLQPLTSSCAPTMEARSGTPSRSRLRWATPAPVTWIPD